MALSFKYGAEALAMLGIAYGLIKWVGRNLRSLISDSRMESARVEAIAASTPVAAADALVRQGIVSAEELARHDAARARVPRRDRRAASRRGCEAAAAARPPTPVSSSAVATTAARCRADDASSYTAPPDHADHVRRWAWRCTAPGCGVPLDREARSAIRRDDTARAASGRSRRTSSAGA